MLNTNTYVHINGAYLMEYKARIEVASTFRDTPNKDKGDLLE